LTTPNKVSSLSEAELISRIKARLPPPPDWLIVGVGDDAAVIEPERNRLEVQTVDALVEGIHFDRAFTPPEAIGHRAVAVNLSDLAAMGATPRLALLSMGLPAGLPLADFDAIVESLVTVAARHRLHVVGGNLTRSPGPLIIDVAVTGTVKRRQVLTRSGARPGDEIYVSGSLGGAAAGLQALQVRLGGAVPPAAATSADTTDIEARYLYPDPRVRLGTLLARNRAATACIDLSDGLADGLRQIAEASSVGVEVDAEALPIDTATRAWFEARGDDAILASMSGGDDYELLLTVRPRLRKRLRAAERHGGVSLTRIGVCTTERSCLLRRRTAEGLKTVPLPHGFSHFR
jgi:thiamine-monophosphate kinase